MITEDRPLCVMVPTRAKRFGDKFPDTCEVPRTETYPDHGSVGDPIECCRAKWFKEIAAEDLAPHACWNRTEVQCLEVALYSVKAGDYPFSSFYGPFCEFHRPRVIEL